MFITLFMQLLGLKMKNLLLWEKTFKVQAFFVINKLFFQTKKSIKHFFNYNQINSTFYGGRLGRLALFFPQNIYHFIDLLTCWPSTKPWLYSLHGKCVGTEKVIQHAKDQSYSLVDVLQKKCLLHVMKYTLQTWNRNLLQYLNVFHLTNFICEETSIKIVTLMSNVYFTQIVAHNYTLTLH